MEREGRARLCRRGCTRGWSHVKNTPYPPRRSQDSQLILGFNLFHCRNWKVHRSSCSFIERIDPLMEMLFSKGEILFKKKGLHSRQRASRPTVLFTWGGVRGVCPQNVAENGRCFYTARSSFTLFFTSKCWRPPFAPLPFPLRAPIYSHRRHFPPDAAAGAAAAQRPRCHFSMIQGKLFAFNGTKTF